MYPAADDNYGLDACSLICLHCQPPVLVMATGSRKIYHCIALENEKPYDSEQVIEMVDLVFHQSFPLMYVGHLNFAYQ